MGGGGPPFRSGSAAACGSRHSVLTAFRESSDTGIKAGSGCRRGWGTGPGRHGSGRWAPRGRGTGGAAPSSPSANPVREDASDETRAHGSIYDDGNTAIHGRRKGGLTKLTNRFSMLPFLSDPNDGEAVPNRPPKSPSGPPSQTSSRRWRAAPWQLSCEGRGGRRWASLIPTLQFGYHLSQPSASPVGRGGAPGRRRRAGRERPRIECRQSLPAKTGKGKTGKPYFRMPSRYPAPQQGRGVTRPLRDE